VSHELRTPLNVILGNADLLARLFYGSLTEKQTSFVKRIDDSGKHLLQLINDLLDVAKIEAGAVEIHWEQFPPTELFDATVAMMMTEFHKKELAVNVTVEPALTAIHGDLRKCRQILLNLLSNAVKYTPDGGKIAISAVAQEGQVLVTIEDNGIGIPADDLPHIFDKFYRVKSPETDDIVGSGLGLSLVKSIIDKHQGRIWVRSQPGKGSAFTLVLMTVNELEKIAARNS